MMGDEMAVRSGGIYGNPASSYTLAQPSSMISGIGGVVSGIAKAGVGMYSALQGYKYAQKQAALNLESLRKEREYNVKNYEQNMADILATNKMSFYTSGLDLSSRTVTGMMETNRAALQEDLDMMKYNYDVQERSIQNQMKANKRKLVGDMVSSVVSIF